MISSIDKIKTNEDRLLAESLRTFHTTLLENSSTKDRAERQRVMWVEAYHPADSKFALGCEFVQPPMANTDERFDLYSKELDQIEEITRN